MSDRDPSAAEVTAAYRNMLAQKAAGEWDEDRSGDVPMRLGPVKVPHGYRTLSELGHGLTRVGASLEGEAAWTIVGLLADDEISAVAVAADGSTSQIPCTIWLNLMHDAGARSNADLSVVWDCLTGSAFEPAYVGCTAIVLDADYQRLLAHHRNEVPKANDAPWTGHRSITAWLGDAAAGAWADKVLHSGGRSADERGRREVFKDAIIQHRKNFELASVDKVRNRAGFTING